MKKSDVLSLSSDLMFCEVMRQPEVCLRFLRELLGKDLRKLEYINKQEDLSGSVTEHGLRLDVYVEDEAGNRYDIEMQKTSHRNLGYRVRYAQDGLDRRILEKGAAY